MLPSNFIKTTTDLLKMCFERFIVDPASSQPFVSISYSSTERFASQYLQLALVSIGVTPQMIERGSKPRIAFTTDRVNVHFAIIPTDYNNLFSVESDKLEREIRTIAGRWQTCHIVFVRSEAELGNRRIESLITSTKQLGVASADLIVLSLYESFFNFTQKVTGTIMSNPSDEVMKIAKPYKELGFVRKESLFSDLFYKMGTLGIRHCPVVDPRTCECFRIISRRDLVKLVPPGNMLIPREVQDQTGIEINPMTLINLIDELGDKKIGELFPDTDLISVSPHDRISRAVELLSVRHLLGDKRAYISGLPVLDGRKLTGFISYTDVLKKFISFQDEYLKTTIEKIATMAKPDKPLWTLHASQHLRDALIRLDNVRSLPVVDKQRSDKLIGFVEDVQVMAYNHSAFTEFLGVLGVKHFMTPVSRLFTPMPGSVLGKCIEKYWESSNGMYPASTLAVCNTSEGNDKRLMGVLSYVDILRGWSEWQAAQDNQQEELVQ